MEGFEDYDQTAVELCARCGKDSSLWSEPVTRDGDRFCCPGCAAGTTCTCEPVGARRAVSIELAD